MRLIKSSSTNLLCLFLLAGITPDQYLVPTYHVPVQQKPSNFNFQNRRTYQIHLIQLHIYDNDGKKNYNSYYKLLFACITHKFVTACNESHRISFTAPHSPFAKSTSSKTEATRDTLPYNLDAFFFQMPDLFHVGSAAYVGTPSICTSTRGNVVHLVAMHCTTP